MILGYFKYFHPAKYSKDQLLSLELPELTKLLNKYEIKPGNIKQKTVKKLKVNKLWEALQAGNSQNKENLDEKLDRVNLKPETGDNIRNIKTITAETPSSIDSLNKTSSVFYVIKPTDKSIVKNPDDFIFNEIRSEKDLRKSKSLINGKPGASDFFKGLIKNGQQANMQKFTSYRKYCRNETTSAHKRDIVQTRF